MLFSAAVATITKACGGFKKAAWDLKVTGSFPEPTIKRGA